MKARILGLLAVALLAGPLTARAGFIIDTDGANEFDGTFSFTIPAGSAAVPDRTFSSGGLLPGTNRAIDGLFGERRLGTETGGIGRARLYTDIVGGSGGVGGPDDPFVDKLLTASAQPFANEEGSYDNSAAAVKVYWWFTNMNDGGGRDGTFSGAFCFSTSPNGCTPTPAPEPGTLALLGLGLAGLAASRRRKR